MRIVSSLQRAVPGCLAVIAACSSEADVDATLVQVSSPVVLEVVDSETHLDHRLGEGYDSVTGKTKARCVDFETIPTGSPTARLEMRGSDVQQRIRNTLGGGAGLQAGFGPASAGLSGDLDKSLEETESVTTLAYVVDATLPSRSLDKVRLNDTGRTARAAKRWREVCGDEVLYQEKRGSLFSAVLRIEYTSREAKREIEAGAKVSLAGSLGEVSARLKTADASVLSNLTVKVSIYQFGGSVHNLGRALGNQGHNEQGSSSAAAMLECGANNMKACHQLIQSALTYSSSEAAGFSRIGATDPDPHVATLSFVTTSYNLLNLGLALEKSAQEQMDDFAQSAKAKGDLPTEAVGLSLLDLPRLGWSAWHPSSEPKFQHYSLRGAVCGTVFVVPGTSRFYLPVGPLQNKYIDLIAHPLSQALGYPKGPVKLASDGLGQKLEFEQGAIYAKGNTVSVLQGPIFNHYEVIGAVAGALGYPLSGLSHVAEDHELLEFENGAIYRRGGPETVMHLTGSLHAAWKRAGGVHGMLGFPTSSAGRTEEGERVQFEHGSLHSLPMGDILLHWKDVDEEIQFRGYLSIAAGRDHMCGLKSDGAAQCWGTNRAQVPTSQAGPFRQLTAGFAHTCGLKPDGAAQCWGFNGQGQAPASLAGPFRQLVAGGVHTCGLKPDGSALCWGENGLGQAPESLVGPFRQLAAGGTHTCGLKPDGSALCWGDMSWVPARAKRGPFRQLAAGRWCTCGLKTDGSVQCWGNNYSGQVPASPAGPFRQLTAGGGHTCGLKADGSALCWGDNDLGQAPASLAGPFRQLATGGRHACGLKVDGSALCWGNIDGVFTATD